MHLEKLLSHACGEIWRPYIGKNTLVFNHTTCKGLRMVDCTDKMLDNCTLLLYPIISIIKPIQFEGRLVVPMVELLRYQLLNSFPDEDFESYVRTWDKYRAFPGSYIISAENSVKRFTLTLRIEGSCIFFEFKQEIDAIMVDSLGLFRMLHEMSIDLYGHISARRAINIITLR